MKFIEKFRKWLLFFCVGSLAVPGIKGMDLQVLGFSFGRVQPFKFMFLAWLGVQAVSVLRSFDSQGFRNKWNSGWNWVFLSWFLLDWVLWVSLRLEHGGPRGVGILLALVLGQAAAFLSIADMNFPRFAFLDGIGSATFILVAFATIEKLFPDSGFVHFVIDHVRDEAQEYFTSRDLHGVASTLTESALGEFSVRSLPLVIPFAFKRFRYAVLALVLAILGLLTLERSSLLAIAFIVIGYLLFFGRKHWKKVTVGFALAGVVLICFVPKHMLIGRFVKGFTFSESDTVSHVALKNLQIRRGQWGAALQAIAYRPWTGIGLDGLANRILNRTAPFESSVARAFHSHNVFLEMGASGGLCALVAFLIFFLSFVRLSFRSRFDEPAPWLFLLGQLVTMNSDCRIYVSWLAITFFWFFGVSQAVVSSTKRAASTE